MGSRSADHDRDLQRSCRGIPRIAFSGWLSERMDAEDLIALAGARGIDLSRVGGNASDTRGDARRRRRTAVERRLGIEVIESASGNSSRSVRRTYWTIAELGMATKGIDEVPYLTARFQIAGDNSGLTYWRLWFALRYQAGRMAQREGWRPLVPGRTPRDPKTRKPILGAIGDPHHYLDDLAQLVLDEDRFRPFFVADPALYAEYMAVEQPTWDKVLEPRFVALRARFERWSAIALAMVRRWLMSDPQERRA